MREYCRLARADVISNSGAPISVVDLAVHSVWNLFHIFGIYLNARVAAVGFGIGRWFEIYHRMK